MVRTLPIGGYRRAPGVPQLGLFIRDNLSNGEVTWAHKLYTEYRGAVTAIPLRRGKGKRKGISYEGFRRYLHAMRKLGLVEYVIDPDTGEIDGSEAELTGGSVKMPRLYFRMVPGAAGSSDWQNIWAAL